MTGFPCRSGTAGGVRAAGLAALVAACSGSPAPPDLADLYERAAQAHDEPRNPVVVIPGIMGSKLEHRRTGELVWGAFDGGFADPEEPEGARAFALPMRPGAQLDELADEVYASGALETLRVNFFGLPFGVAAYEGLLIALGVGGYRDESLGLAGAIDYGSEHYTCFQFAYDWRRDIPENARRLDAFLREKAEYVRAEHRRRTGRDREVRFDVVAHSMGGLVTRWYLRYGAQPLPAGEEPPAPTWAGTRWIERAVLVGTPNAGSLGAFDSLIRGLRLGFFLPRYPPAVLGTLPSIYQLLPRGRHGAVVRGEAPEERVEDLLDPELWERLGWGLLDPDQAPVLADLLPGVPAAERRAIAREHLVKCLERARRVQAALDLPAEAPPGLELQLFAADAVPTASVYASWDDGVVSPLETAPGDGSVLRSSALGDERPGRPWTPRVVTPIPWTRVTFLFRDHLGLTRDPAFLDNLLYMLLEEPR